MHERDVIDTAWRELRRASAARDVAQVSSCLNDALAVGLLQTCGDAALRSLHQMEGASLPGVERLINALHDRDWSGDRALADQVSAVSAAVALERPWLSIQLGDLADLAASPEGGYLDLHTGTVIPSVLAELDSLDVDPADDPDRWVDVPGVDTQVAWRDMADFASSIEDAAAREDIAAATQGSKAFRRFQEALDRHEQYRASWRVFSSERQLGRARSWLSDLGYVALAQSPSS